MKFARIYLLLTRLIPFLIVALILSLCLHAGWQLKADLGGDATQNFLSSYNFYSSFEYGHHLGQAGFRREPLPNWTLAFFLWLFYRPAIGLSREEVLSNQEILDAAVMVNIFWALILFLSLWLLARKVFVNTFTADISASFSILVSHFAFVRTEYDNLNTELVASALFVVLALSLLYAMNAQSFFSYVAVGLAFGLLVLTKASGAYIALVTMPLIAFVTANGFSMSPSGLAAKCMKRLLLIAIGFALVVSPWVLRNYSEFGEATIAQGGGRVLWIRSEFNKINRDQYIGAFYAYSPRLLRESIWEPYFGYRASQLQCGGDLQLHNRGEVCDIEHLEAGRFEDVVSLYERGKKALPLQAKAQAAQSGAPYDVDKLGKEEFFATVRQKPLDHLFLSIPLAWRGIWSFSIPDHFGTVPGLALNFAIMVNLIFIPILALFYGDKILLLMSLVPASYFWFYALLSQFWPRFSEPFIPVASLIFCYTISTLIKAFRQRNLLKA